MKEFKEWRLIMGLKSPHLLAYQKDIADEDGAGGKGDNSIVTLARRDSSSMSIRVFELLSKMAGGGGWVWIGLSVNSSENPEIVCRTQLSVVMCHVWELCAVLPARGVSVRKET